MYTEPLKGRKWQQARCMSNFGELSLVKLSTTDFMRYFDIRQDFSSNIN